MKIRSLSSQFGWLCVRRFLPAVIVGNKLVPVSSHDTAEYIANYVSEVVG